MSSGLLQANDTAQQWRLIGHNRQHSGAPSSLHGWSQAPGDITGVKIVQYPEHNLHHSLSALNREKRRHKRWRVCNRKTLQCCQRLTESGMFGGWPRARRRTVDVRNEHSGWRACQITQEIKVYVRAERVVTRAATFLLFVSGATGCSWQMTV